MRIYYKGIALIMVLILVIINYFPIDVVNAESIYEYSGVTIMVGESAPYTPDLSNGVEFTAGDDYGTVTTLNSTDPYFTIDMSDTTWNGRYLAIKYRAAKDTLISNSYIYPETTAGGWSLGGAGLFKADKMVCNGEWTLVTYDVFTELQGADDDGPTEEQLSATIKSLRIGGVNVVGGTIDIAYVGIFDSKAEAENYDAMFSEVYTTVDTSYKLEVEPDFLTSLEREYYNLNDSRVTNNSSVVKTSYRSMGRIRNPIRATWTPNEGNNESKYIVSGSNKYIYLSNDSLVNDNRYANNISFIFSSDVMPENGDLQFAGFLFNFGYENDGSVNEFFESNQLNNNASVGRSGIGVNIYHLSIEVFVICLDEATGNLSQISYNFNLDESIGDVFHSFKAVDNAGGIIRFYMDEALVASVAYSNDKVPTDMATDYSERYYRKAEIYDKDGVLMASSDIALISYTKAVAMGTCGRAINIDNVCLEPTGTTAPTLSLDATEYDAGTDIQAVVNYNDTAVINERIEIYREGETPGTDKPTLSVPMGCALKITFEAPFIVGNYFAVLMGTSGTKSIEYSEQIPFTVYTSIKSFISIQDTSLIAGGTKAIEISVPENLGISYLALKVKYDPSCLTLKEANNGDAFSNAIFTDSPTLENNPYVMTWANAEDIIESGVVGELVFDASADATGSTELELEIIEVFSTTESGEILEVTSLYSADNGVVTFVNEDDINKPLSFYGTTLSIHNDLTIKFFVSKTDVEEGGYTNLYMTAVFGGNLYTLLPIETNVGGTEYYCFSFENVAPQMMTDTVAATLYGEIDGITYNSDVKEYSVTTYVYSMLSKTTDTKLQTLLVDMVNYGAASQIYTQYNVNNLASSRLTEEQKALGTAELRELSSVKNIPETDDSYDVGWTGVTLSLENKVAIKGFINSTKISGAYILVRDENNAVLGEVKEENLVETTLADGTIVTAFVFEELNAAQMSKTVKFVVMSQAGIEISPTATYSIESYAYSMQNSEIAELADLVKTMIMYGDSAYAYVN